MYMHIRYVYQFSKIDVILTNKLIKIRSHSSSLLNI